MSAHHNVSDMDARHAQSQQIDAAILDTAESWSTKVKPMYTSRMRSIVTVKHLSVQRTSTDSHCTDITQCLKDGDPCIVVYRDDLFSMNWPDGGVTTVLKEGLIQDCTNVDCSNGQKSTTKNWKEMVFGVSKPARRRGMASGRGRAEAGD